MTKSPTSLSIRVDSVAAYFRNDQQNGIALMSELTGDHGNRLARWCEETMPFLDAQLTPAEAIARLTIIGRDRPRLETPVAHRIIATIHWLERRAHIVSDEYNGVIWTGVTSDGALLALRHDAPDAEHWRELCRASPKSEMRGLDQPDFERLLHDFLGTPKSN